MKRLFVLLLMLGLTAPLFAQERAVAVRAGRMLDVRSGELRSNVIILIRSDRIVAVGENLRLPSDAQVIDLGQATVLPGLIDMHTHLTFDHRFFGYRGLGLSESPRPR